MKIGIFPGSFNPIHIGHLAIANYICEFESLDQIWFLVTPQNPIKGEKETISGDIRMKLVDKAIQGYDKFKICTLEWELPRPTYTINTLQKLRVLYPTMSFELIIGADNWETFHRWKDYQRILNNFRVIIYPRKGSNKFSIYHPNARMVNAPKVEVSSTFIRKCIRKDKDIRFFLPSGVYEIIKEENLYKSPEPVTSLDENEEFFNIEN